MPQFMTPFPHPLDFIYLPLGCSHRWLKTPALSIFIGFRYMVDLFCCRQSMLCALQKVMHYFSIAYCSQ